MKYVLDSSIAFKWVVPELHSDKAIRLRDDYRKGVHELISPDIFPIEIGHALTRAERQGRVTTANGWALWLNVMADAPRLVPSLALMPHAYPVSSQERVGLYDCLYLTLAQQESCEFLTADDRLLKRLQPRFPFIVSLVSLP
jgi:predicted nucleic acid-binding protein